jgi:Tfp pilus assembly protein PilO
MKLSSRDQFILAGVLIVLVGVAFVMLAIYPRFQDLSQAQTDLAAAQSEIDNAKALLATRQAAKAAAAQTQARLTRLENQIPDAPEMPAVIIELQDTANDAGVTFDKLLTTKPAPTVDGYEKIHLSFEVVGEWDDVIDYVQRVSDLQRAVRILDVSLTPINVVSSTDASPTASEQPIRIRGMFNVEAYMLTREKPTGGSAAPAPAQ